MLTATLQKAKGFRSDHIYEVSAAGSPIATLNETKFTFNHDGLDYTILRKGFLSPEYQLKCADGDMVTITEAPFQHKYTMVLDGKEWILKAQGISALKFVLFLKDIEIGTVSLGGSKEIIADLPDELPVCVQLFLLLLLIWKSSG